MTKMAVVLLVLSIASPCFGDAVDDAEAKRRGVPVQQIQLENAQEKIKDLQRQVDGVKAQLKATQDELAKSKSDVVAKQKTADELAAELAKLKESLTPSQKKQIETAASLEARITDALQKHEVVVGMTVAQVTKSAGGEPKLKGENAQHEKSYEWPLMKKRRTVVGGRGADEDVQAGLIVGTVVNDRLVEYQIETFTSPRGYSVPAQEIRR